MRLIDADALKESFKTNTFRGNKFGVVFDTYIDHAPTIEERKKGKWVVDGPRFKGGNDWMHCSECGRGTLNTPMERTNYCPNCGADMRGET